MFVQKYDVGLNEIKSWGQIKQTFQLIGNIAYFMLVALCIFFISGLFSICKTVCPPLS
jgi:hypothetical protein